MALSEVDVVQPDGIFVSGQDAEILEPGEALATPLLPGLSIDFAALRRLMRR